MSPQNRIVPHLWFDKQAKEAAYFYASVFPNSKVLNVTSIKDTPSGDTDIVSMEIYGQPFQAISAGPQFKFTPAISFFVTFHSSAEVDAIYKVLSEGASILMPLDTYPFSERFVWLEDKYGLSWQLAVKSDLPKQIITNLTFTGAQCGKAEEAIEFFVSLFPDSRIDHMQHYGDSEAPNLPKSVKYAAFTLAGQSFAAIDSAEAHAFGFNEAVSLMVYCDTQEEIDHYWDKLSADPKAEQCGWLKDRFGISWQIVPTAMDTMMSSANPEQAARVTEAFLQMKKFDLAALQRAFDGE